MSDEFAVGFPYVGLRPGRGGLSLSCATQLLLARRDITLEACRDRILRILFPTFEHMTTAFREQDLDWNLVSAKLYAPGTYDGGMARQQDNFVRCPEDATLVLVGFRKKPKNRKKKKKPCIFVGCVWPTAILEDNMQRLRQESVHC